MTLKEIAYKNLMRRKGKAIFLVAGLVIGVATVVAVIGFVEAMTNEINHKLEKYGANILIVPRTDNLTLTYGGLSLGGVSFEMQEIHQADLAGIQSIKNARNVAAVGPLVLGAIQLHNNRVLIAGVDFNVTRILKPWWRIKGTEPNENDVLLGADTARVLKLDKGDSILVNGRHLNVSGVLHPTGSQDDQLIFMHLLTAQRLLNKEGKVSMAEVAALCQACPITEMVKQISEALPGAKVMAIQQVVKGRMETLSQFKKFSYGISAVVILIGSLVVLVTMMGSVRERTKEIGIFRAIGFRRHHIMRIVFTEAGIVSSLAGIMGYFMGFSGVKLGFLIFYRSRDVAIPLNFELAIFAIVLSMLVGLGSSIYPAILAARLDPNEALRAL